MTHGPLWTVADATTVFARQGQAIEEWRLRMVIRAVSLQPAARAPSGELGGRGKAMYPAGALQRMHALITDLVSGDT